MGQNYLIVFSVRKLMTYMLFPLYCCWWLVGDIVDDACDLRYLLGYPRRNSIQDRVGQPRKHGGHAIPTLNHLNKALDKF